MARFIALLILCRYLAVCQDVNKNFADAIVRANGNQSQAKSDALSDQLIGQRASLFEFVVRGSVQLTTLPESAPAMMVRFSRPSYPEFPSTLSNTVVVASFRNVQSFLLPSGKGIYTVFRFDVSDLLKGSSMLGFPSIDVVELGGSVTTSSGRVIALLTHGQGQPLQLGQNYLLFLNTAPEGTCYRFFKVWRVDDAGRLRANYYDDMGRVRSSASTIEGQALIRARSLVIESK